MVLLQAQLSVRVQGSVLQLARSYDDEYVKLEE